MSTSDSPNCMYACIQHKVPWYKIHTQCHTSPSSHCAHPIQLVLADEELGQELPAVDDLESKDVESKNET